MLSDEFALISEINKTLGKPSKRVLLGIGDDAAVVKGPKGNLVATIDTMVEGVHFDLSYMTARELGHKALAVNLSDLAAMGAKPLYALVSLGLRQDMNEYFVTELYEGMRGLAKRYQVDIIGGNLSQSPNTLVVDIVALGETPKTGIKRSDARVGDLVAVTGELGLSAAGLNVLKRLGRTSDGKFKDAFAKHLTPEPRVKEALEILKTGGVGAMIDISDGLARELHHLANQSQVGMLIEEANLPISGKTEEAAKEISGNALAWGLYGGEDYELLFTIKPAAFKKLRIPATVIGKVTPKDKGVRLHTRTGEISKLEPRGWNHFVRRRKAP